MHSINSIDTSLYFCIEYGLAMHLGVVVSLCLLSLNKMTQEEVNSVRSDSASSKNEGIDFFQFVKLLKRYWWQSSLTFAGVLGAVALWTFFQTPIYEARGQLILKKKDQTSALTGLSEKLGQMDPLSTQSNPLETEAQVLQSRPVLDKAIAQLDLRNRKGEVLTDVELRKVFKVKPIRNTDVLEVTFRDPKPKKAAELVNVIFQLYLQNDVQINRAQTRAARQFIEAQLPRTEKQLQSAEVALRQFKEANQVVDLKGEAEVAVEGIGKLTEELAKAEAQYSEVRERSTQLQQRVGMDGTQAIALGELSEAGGLQETLKDLQKVEDQLAVDRTVYEETHPRIIDLRNKQTELKKSLQGRVTQTLRAENVSPAEGNIQKGEFGLDLSAELVKAEVDQRGAAQRVLQIQRFIQTQQQRTDVLPILEQKQMKLERDLEVARISYKNLLKSLQDAQLAENQNIGNARVLDQAKVPILPVSPKIVLNLVLGSVLGLLASTGMTLLLAAKDKIVRTSQDVRALFDYPVLGTIPFSKSLQPSSSGESLERVTSTYLVMRDEPRSGESEAYRALLANLKFSRSDTPLNAIVVSSSMPGEGKSTTVANLALAMTDLGARVLIIDCDLRRPRQHQIWGMANSIGISNVLVDSAPLVGSIQEETERLSVLTSGVLPPNPVALLDSHRMAQLMEDLRCTYDYILIDTPPLTVAADALILSKVADSLLMVARPGILMTPAANTAREAIMRSGQPIVGMVLNAIKLESEDNYYYYGKEYYGTDQNDKKNILKSEKVS
jgi:polysaccharide biosynthesis transport protein